MDELAEALSELRALTTCRCGPAFTERDLHETDCAEEYREDVEVIARALWKPEPADNDPCEVCAGHDCPDVHVEVFACPVCGSEFDEFTPQFGRIGEEIIERSDRKVTTVSRPE